VRRAQTRNPTAFLIDQHRRIGAPNAVVQRVHKLAYLVGRSTIAAKQNEADGIGLGKKIPLLCPQYLAGATENDSTRPARPR
jgi:hypothetical protein